MERKEEIDLFTNIAVIREKVEALATDEKELEVNVQLNTKFRYVITGFFIILIAGSGLFLTFSRIKTAIGQQPIERSK